MIKAVRARACVGIQPDGAWAQQFQGVSGVHEARTHTIEDMRGGSGDGQGLAEYALILALIAIMALSALVSFGREVAGILSTIGGSL
jgi:Flp pilus assembly pilin Flp